MAYSSPNLRMAVETLEGRLGYWEADVGPVRQGGLGKYRWTAVCH